MNRSLLSATAPLERRSGNDADETDLGDIAIQPGKPAKNMQRPAMAPSGDPSPRCPVHVELTINASTMRVAGGGYIYCDGIVFTWAAGVRSATRRKILQDHSREVPF